MGQMQTLLTKKVRAVKSGSRIKHTNTSSMSYECADIRYPQPSGISGKHGASCQGQPYFVCGKAGLGELIRLSADIKSNKVMAKTII